MIEIPLQGTKGRGKTAKINDEDLPLVKGKTWTYSQGYAVTSTYPSGVASMHRLIAKCADRNRVVNHINGDRLDNQRENLEIVSRFDNWKKKTKRLIQTEHEGIFFDQYSERYLVRLYGNPDKLYGDVHNAGAYKTIDQAISVRDAEMLHGGFTTSRGPRSWDKLKTP